MLLEELEHALAACWSGPGGVTVSATRGSALLGVIESASGLDVLTMHFPAGRSAVVLECPLGDAEGYWFPSLGQRRGLPPEWAGHDRTSLVRSSPLGCLYDRGGNTMLSFGLSRQVEECELQFGVAEERRTFMVQIGFDLPEPQALELALVPVGTPLTAAIGRVGQWLRNRVGRPLSIPDTGRVPVYSTWYGYAQDISAPALVEQAKHAAALGCGAMIIDDGWQLHGSGRWYAGCGDWVPDPAKFHDMKGHIAELRSFGLAPLLWIAPLLLGEQSEAYSRLAPYAGKYVDALRAHILDPRHRQAREHFVSSCARLVLEYGLAGLKIDFIDAAAVYHGTPGTGDIEDVGAALLATLGDLRETLASAGRTDVLIEFRQNYIGPATAPFGNLVRASDCPADPVTNRRSIIDLRLLAVDQSVHSDPVVWDLRAGPAVAVRHLMNAYFGVPQISVPLELLDGPTTTALARMLELWVDTRSVVLDGTLDAGLPSEDYPVIRARNGERQIIGIYRPTTVSVDPREARDITVLNATSEPRVLLEWTSAPGAAIIEVWSPQTGSGEPYTVVARSGLMSLAVPAAGTARIRLRPEDLRSEA